MFPKILVSPRDPRRHVHDHIFSLFWADRLGAHLWVCVVLVVEHHHRDQASAVLLVVDKLRPAVVPHAHSPHETTTPLVAMRQAIPDVLGNRLTIPLSIGWRCSIRRHFSLHACRFSNR